MGSSNELPRTLEGFRWLHAGETFVICGCGSSLSTLAAPERFRTIGVNDVGRMFDPDYLVVLNGRQQFAPDRFQYVEQSRARALFTQLPRLGVSHPHVVHFRLGERCGTSIDNPSVLPYTRNSPYVAMALAMHMGAKRIGIIGVDFTDHHFFGETGRHPLTRELARIDGEYAGLYRACLALGIEVFNLSEASRLTAIPKLSLDAFATGSPRGLRIVSYATTPVAGVPPILSRAIAAKTNHQCRTVWATNSYGNGVVFDGDVQYSDAPAEAAALLDEANVVIVHNGRIAPRHAPLLQNKPIVTLAHNYRWNVDARWVEKGFPGLVVAQYQATLPEFDGWTAVPNPIPWWEPACQPLEKPEPVSVAFTPSGKHERYPCGHRLYWHSKGYATTMEILERLAARHALRIEAIGERQVSLAESLAMKQRAHIVIDECVTGSYHRNSLEGLAAGCVVVNGVGILPAVAAVLRDVAEAEEIPFLAARLDDLESVLEEAIARGAADLAREGMRNRRWLEEHWRFERQWQRFWEPAIHCALDHARRGGRTARIEAVPPPQPKRTSLVDATVVIPHGGAHRLRNLRLTLDHIRKAGVVQNVIVVEMDDEPHARELAAETRCRYAFIRQESVFHKARAMNAAIPLIETSRFFWLDADMLVNAVFLERALDELDARRLDCLVPWTACRYLSEDDTNAVAAGTKTPEECHPVNVYSTRTAARGGVVLVRTQLVQTFGGLCEDFRGWGGEDNAWFMKASVLGRAAATSRPDQVIHHAWHALSGGYGPAAAIASNPEYQRNLQLLYEMRRFNTRERYLARFPAPAAFSSPWYGIRRVACEPGGEEVWSVLRQLYGDAVEPCALDAEPDGVARANGDARQAAIELALQIAMTPAGSRTRT